MSTLESLWLLPLGLALVGVVLGLLLPSLDGRLLGATATDESRWLARFAPAPSPAESLVTTSAGALGTILGVAFSLTVVTLQLATVQYTSRILRRFLADRLTQFVLGTYLGTISFLLLLLRAIQPQGPEGGFVPPMSFVLGLVLILGCLVLLAVFLHHLARSIQAATVIAEVGRQTIGALQKLGVNAPGGERTELTPPAGKPYVLTSQVAGYLQLLDEDALLKAAPAGCTFMRVEARTGHFLLPGKALVSLWPGSPVDKRCARKLRAAFALGRERTNHQDVLFGVRQLVDIALRALSPGVNDVTTALMVVNELATVGHAVAHSRAGAKDGHRLKQRGETVVLVPRFGLETFLEHAFSELPRAAMPQPRVLSRLLEVIAEIAELSEPGEVREALIASGLRMRDFVDMANLSEEERQHLYERIYELTSIYEGGHDHHVDSL